MTLRQVAVFALVAMALCFWATAVYGQATGFTLLTSVSVGTAVYDLETTYRALQRCSHCREANPLMRLKSKPLAYTVSLGLTGGVIYGSARLKQRGSKWWWVPLVVSSVAHGVAGRWNQTQ